MRLLLSLVLLAFAVCADAATVYKWVDKDGRVHYTQTPPPDPDTKVSERSVDGGRRPELAGYCGAVREFALSMASAMSRGMPLESAVSVARDVERRMQEFGAQDSQVREIAYFVYGKKPGLRARQISLGGIAELAHDNCMSGNFAVIRGIGRGGGGVVHGSGARAGSGWFARSGVVVTSLHVVDGATRITLHLADGSQSQAQVLDSDRAHDLAILATDARGVPGLPVRTQPLSIGAAVFTIGFPHADVMGVKPKLANGVISSTAGVQDDPSSYQISVPVQAGNSGGPLLDMNGQVVGVVSSKLRASRMLQRTGDLTENVNYAVKSNHVVDLLGNRSEASAAGSGDLQALAAAAEASVVRIVAE